MPTKPNGRCLSCFNASIRSRFLFPTGTIDSRIMWRLSESLHLRFAPIADASHFWNTQYGCGTLGHGRAACAGRIPGLFAYNECCATALSWRSAAVRAWTFAPFCSGRSMHSMHIGRRCGARKTTHNGQYFPTCRMGHFSPAFSRGGRCFAGRRIDPSCRWRFRSLGLHSCSCESQRSMQAYGFAPLVCGEACNRAGQVEQQVVQ